MEKSELTGLEPQRDYCKYDRVFPFNVYFSHLSSLMNLGARRPLVQSDLGSLPDDVKVDLCLSRFETAWEREVREKAPDKRSLFNCMMATTGVLIPIISNAI